MELGLPARTGLLLPRTKRIAPREINLEQSGLTVKHQTRGATMLVLMNPIHC